MELIRKNNKVFIPLKLETSIDSNFKKPSCDSNVTKLLLEEKRPVNGEIELTLFENCNIECDFCHHDKKSTVGMSKDDMFSKLSLIENFLIERKNTVEYMQFNMVGGELFQDRWMDELCNNYYELAIELKNLCVKHSYEMQIVWVTNLLFAKNDIVKNLIDTLNNHNIKNYLIASYDFDGRPLSNRYKQNIEILKDNIISINAVGTKPSIEKFLKNDDEYFKYLYNTFNIYFDDYIPDKGHDNLIPSDKLIYDWYVFMAENYPNIAPVNELLINENNQMHCLSLNKLTIFPDNKTSNCRWHRYDQNDFNTEFNIHDNAGMMQNFMDSNGCLSCEYFKRCGLSCFTQWDWKNRVKDMDICKMKAFFNFVTKGIKI